MHVLRLSGQLRRLRILAEGAEITIADLGRAETWPRALLGIDKAYLITPVDVAQVMLHASRAAAFARSRDREPEEIEGLYAALNKAVASL